MDVITYRIVNPQGDEYVFPVHLSTEQILADSEDLDRLAKDAPGWTKLENNKCGNCPLDSQQHEYCPAALSIHQIAVRFQQDLSITRVDVSVETATRTYTRNTDLQTCLRSLFGLIMATSGCPILSRMRALAIFHLPFSNLEESIFRIVGTYLIKQYLAMKRGETPDWELEGLAGYYRQLGPVNKHLMLRLRQASREDANINAIQQFISISTLTEIAVDSILKDFSDLLDGYC
jgi:hypothetical protein